jgi:hypothetical protein
LHLTAFQSRTIARVLVTASALVASAAVAGAASSNPAPSRQVVRTGGEYVVTFTGSVEDAARAIHDAGGTVLDVNEAMHVALVASPSAEFLAAVHGEGIVNALAAVQ